NLRATRLVATTSHLPANKQGRQADPPVFRRPRTRRRPGNPLGEHNPDRNTGQTLGPDLGSSTHTQRRNRGLFGRQRTMQSPRNACSRRRPIHLRSGLGQPRLRLPLYSRRRRPRRPPSKTNPAHPPRPRTHTSRRLTPRLWRTRRDTRTTLHHLIPAKEGTF